MKETEDKVINTKELELLKKDIYELCLVVGKYQLKYHGGKDLKKHTKSSITDIVTEVDVKSEEMIIEFIKRRYPDHSILAEESGVEEKASEYTWIIDPVDGTVNYAHGYPLFAISIGVKKHDSMLLGCIYLPVLDTFYSAIKGEGAYCNNEKISVSEVNEMHGAIMATGFPYTKKTNPNNNLDYFSKIVPQLGGIRRSGSACVDLVHVAHGKIEAYFEMYLNQWDIRPGILIIEEAGGKVNVNQKDNYYNVVATNGILHDKLINELQKVKKGDY